MSERPFQERVVESLDDALGVTEAMRKIPARVFPGDHGSMPAEDLERMVRAATRAEPETLPPADLVRAHKARRRRRTILAVAGTALLAAAVAQWRWSGADPTQGLTYEQAFGVLFDESYALEERHSAHGKIYASLRKAIRALKQAELRPDLRASSTEALSTIGTLLESPAPADVAKTLRGEALEDLVKQLGSPRATPDTVAEVLGRVRAGIHVLDLARMHGPRFLQSSDTVLRKLLPAELGY